ncbi:hypothetical protein QYM36_006238 [Artemia franciscana]|uniref:Uncharacterized protein n=1 Tax=Artemia franciscana TaxID=6661 RepID=A0AA88L952_ARTSF|nr:hypothetical protein QYM36_006238 [Artemia franciscana]
MERKLTDKETMKIIFDEESDIKCEESDVDLTSDEEDVREPTLVSLEVVDTFLDPNVINVITQPNVEDVSESNSNDEEHPPS